MQRLHFLNALQTVKNALSDNELIPLLTHFWFFGDRVMAFNDQIAISTPLITSFKGAVPGEVMLRLLLASRATEIVPEAKDNNLVIKSGGKRNNTLLKLGLLPPATFKLFTMPELEGKSPLPTKHDDFLRALNLCLGSVTIDMTVTDQMGITLIKSKDNHLLFFATNGQTIRRARLPIVGKCDIPDRVILSGAFCKELVRLKKIDDLQVVTGNKNHAIARSGETILFGRLIISDRPLDFTSMFAEYTKGPYSKTYPVPERFSYAIKRAIIVSDDVSHQVATEISCEERMIRLHSESIHGEVRDEIVLKQDMEQPATTLRLRAKHIHDGLDDFDQMILTDRCMIMRNTIAHYLISSMGS
jgi:DNA polymerase III sliding clamp (beta) subunit (PCNA family)